ncbi:ABC transporter permease [Labedaea rhizosphaerae]|uniref:NitT/TauT family transport system permease protein n=1 Tax=Labedaea rhizosphaerae TaxID=598644 RepID=A0A4V3D065_LABRH|nr:ABC transporter permease [Labedaea rhizosphaerae]TDQ04565.1 NitT/TauT family transport system permease protein [Labedaea rhizosphaerae]
MRLIRNVAGVVVFLLIWEGFGRSGYLPVDYFPPPTVVAGTLADQFSSPEYLRALVATLLTWLIAFGISVGVAVPVGLVLGSVPFVRDATRSVIEFLRPIPAVAMIPLALVLFGNGPSMKITLAVYAAIWPIMFNVIYALGQVDQQYLDTARSFGLGRVRTTLRVKLPDVLPFAITGFRLSATVALLVIVAIELVNGGSIGIGTYVMQYGENVGHMDIVFAGAVVAGALGVLINSGIALLQRKLVPWGGGTE